MYRVKFFSKKLISRNFCDKTVAAKRNFHTCTLHSVEIAAIKSHTVLAKIFVKVAILLKKLIKSKFDEKFFQWD